MPNLQNKSHYLGNGKMLLVMADVEGKGAYAVSNRFSIATQGIKVEGGQITVISKLDAK